jgi:hypothetical protein
MADALSRPMGEASPTSASSLMCVARRNSPAVGGRSSGHDPDTRNAGGCPRTLPAMKLAAVSDADDPDATVPCSGETAEF